MASGNAIPSNGTNIIQTSQGVAIQVIPNLQYGAQQLGTSTSAPQQVPQNSRLERFFNAELKALGTVQIMIGLMHFGFIAVAICVASADYIASSVGYSVWAGILFISSGSLCISSAKIQNRSLVKCSVGMNITSAIIALFGIPLYIIQLTLSDGFSLNHNSEDGIKNVGLASVLLLFTLLEFCITVSLAHLGCQATCCANDQAVMGFVPYQVVTGYAPLATEPNSSSPPAYDNVVAKPV